jgi:hypothetical protein
MGEKLTRAQARMLRKVCAAKWGGVQQWEALLEGPRATLDVLVRLGLVEERFGALGSHPWVKATPAGRAALSQPSQETNHDQE